MSLALLFKAIEAVCPVESVNTNRVIAFKPEATPQQRAAAQAMVDANDFDEPPAWRAPAMADLRARRDRLLDVISGLQADYLTAGDASSATLARDIKQGLKDLPALPALAAAASYDEFKTIALAAYAALVANAPADVKAEFKRYAG